MHPVAYQGAVAPESLAVLVKQGDSGIDLTTATAVSFSVQLPDGTPATWTGALSGATAMQVTATHVFASGDLPMPGRYVVVAALTVPAGTIRTRPQPLTVYPPFEVDAPAVGPS
jgi:hypothetical protein